MYHYNSLEGAVCHYEITDEDVKKGVGNESRLGKAHVSMALHSLLHRLPECRGAWNGGADT